MRGFEFIKGVILEPHPFDMERDLVTATLKKKRSNLLKYYQVICIILDIIFIYASSNSIGDSQVISHDIEQAEIDALYQKLTAKI